MKVTIIAIVVGTLEIVIKKPAKETKATAYWSKVQGYPVYSLVQSPRILRKSPENVTILTVIYEALCFDVAQGRLNGAPNETRTQLTVPRNSGEKSTINHISECSKLALKEYETLHDWVDKVIHRELWDKFKFDHKNKWYMHNPSTVLENDTHTNTFGILTYTLIISFLSDDQTL